MTLGRCYPADYGTGAGLQRVLNSQGLMDGDVGGGRDLVPAQRERQPLDLLPARRLRSWDVESKHSVTEPGRRDHQAGD